MRFVEKRIERLAEDILASARLKRQDAGTIWYREGKMQRTEVNSPDTEGFSEFYKGDRWGGYDRHFTFKLLVAIPETFVGKTTVLEIRTGREGSWDAANPQFVVYVDGVRRQGADVNHREIVLTESAEKGQEFLIVLDAYSGLTTSLSDLFCTIAILDKEAEDLYFDITVPLKSAQLLDVNSPERYRLLSCLEKTVNLIDLREPESTSYKESVTKALKYVREELYGKLCGDSDVTAVCIGHTHIDVAWQWTVAQSREKTVRSFSTVMELMRRYPEYIFMSSQPQLYKYLKEDEPELYNQIKEQARLGRWEAEGAMWLEADCNLTSGESLVRQILLGKRFFKEEFGVDNKILWLPDVFGYSAALPQILAKSGVPYFMTTKLSWNEYNKIPYDTFVWEGIDGSKVLTHFITTTEPENSLVNADMFTTYNGRLAPECIKGAWDRYQQKEINNEILVSYGYGDGGGGPTYEQLETAKRLALGIPGTPKVKYGTAGEFFKQLEKRVSGNKLLPKWVGELYLEFHRGTYTSMARNKRYNRKCEFALLNSELFSQMGMQLSGASYEAETIKNNWELVLLNQFHDILPGSSIKEVYEVSKNEYESVLTSLAEVKEKSIDALLSNVSLEADSVVVFNPVGFERNDAVEVAIPANDKGYILCDDDGNIMPTQTTDNGGMLAYVAGVPAMGYKALTMKEGKYPGENELSISERHISNSFIDIRLNENAELISIYDKQEKREILKTGCRGNVLQAFEDKPFAHDAWDINIYYTEKMWEITEVESVRIVESGPVRACLEIKRRFLSSVIIQKIYVYSFNSRIDFSTSIDWKETHILLKTAFPVDIHANKATYEIQYGNVERPTNWNTSWDYARFEVCAQKWADLSEGCYGISMLNDCKYGHDIKDGVMRLTLIKSPKWPNEDSDRELHTFTYSILPHSLGWEHAGTVKQAYFLNNPAMGFCKRAQKGLLPDQLSFVNTDADNVVIESVKKAEDDNSTIVRLYEYANKRTRCSIRLGFNASEVRECDLMENELSVVETDGSSFNFEIMPYEIKTFKIKEA